MYKEIHNFFHNNKKFKYIWIDVFNISKCIFNTKDFDWKFRFLFINLIESKGRYVDIYFDVHLKKICIDSDDKELKYVLYKIFQLKCNNSLLQEEFKNIYSVITTNKSLNYYYTFYVIFHEIYDYKFYIFWLENNFLWRSYKDCLSYINTHFKDYEILSVKIRDEGGNKTSIEVNDQDNIESIVFKKINDSKNVFKINTVNIFIWLYEDLFRGAWCMHYILDYPSKTRGINTFKFLKSHGELSSIIDIINIVKEVNISALSREGDHSYWWVTNDFSTENCIITDNKTIKIIDLEQMIYTKIIEQPFLLFFRNEASYTYDKLKLYLEYFFKNEVYRELLNNFDTTIFLYNTIRWSYSHDSSINNISSKDLYNLLDYFRKIYPIEKTVR